MTRKQLEQQRERVEAQMRWAVIHGGDQELLDLLRLESDRLFAMICQFIPEEKRRHRDSSKLRQYSPSHSNSGQVGSRELD
jgi:hypothetical protein